MFCIREVQTEKLVRALSNRSSSMQSSNGSDSTVYYSAILYDFVLSVLFVRYAVVYNREHERL